MECCSGTNWVPGQRTGPGPRTVPGPRTGPAGCTGPAGRIAPEGRIGPAGRTAVPEGCTAGIVARTAVADGRLVAMGQWWTPKTACRPRCPGRCPTACRRADC